MVTIVVIDDALKSKEAEIRRMGQAIRASGGYLSNRGVWRAYREAPDRRAFYVTHKRELEECNRARDNNPVKLTFTLAAQ